MRLKYIELMGFKSFAEKTKLEFNKDFVGIVGPNGSGKSNTSDAIRWVLGEQSAKALRGDTMEDVIFAGTEKKARMNMAQVTIAFDNTDNSIALPYEEVTVTRKVYRSGISEYMINKMTVRRKDVRDLFLDTGIGKEGYSIIGQGRIDDILSSRSEDRRAIFEEAAGIAKYKQRKMEAERRLEKTTENLESVYADRKIKEKEADLLRVQAQNAREGYALTKELERSELSLLHGQLDQLESKLEKSQQELERLETIHRETLAALAGVEELVAPYRTDLAELEAGLSRTDASIRALELSRDKHTQTVALKEDQVLFFQQDLDRLAEEKDKLLLRTREARERLEEAGLEKADLGRQSDRLKEEMDRLCREKVDDLQPAREAFDRCQTDLQEVRDRIRYLEFEKDSQLAADATLEEKQVEIRRLQEDLDRQISDLSESLDRDCLELEKVRSEMEDKRAIYDRAKADLAELAEDWDRLVDRLASMDKDRTALESEQTMLKSLIENFEGYQRSVQLFLKAAGRDPSLRACFVGVLADLIKVKPPYEEAIDVSLGGALQNIVVKTEQDGKKLINYLKENRLGRITFLPLDRIRGPKPVYSGAAEELINAADAVDCDPSVRPIILHFLGRTSLVRDIDDAIALSHRFKANRIVSLEGDVINNWGSMVGGRFSTKRSTGLINRQDQLDGIDSRLAEIRSAIREDLQKKSSMAGRREELRKLLEESESGRGSLQESLYRLSRRISEAELKKNNLIEHRSRLQEDLDRKASFSQEDYREKLEELQSLMAEKEKAFKLADDRLKDRMKKDSDREKQLALLQSRMDFSRRELQICENKVYEWEERIDQLEQETKNNGDNRIRIEEELRLNHEVIDRLTGEIEQSSDRLAALKEEADQGRDRLAELTEEIAKELERRDLLSEEKNELEKKLYQNGLNRDNYRDQIGRLCSDYCDQYDIGEEELELRLAELEPIRTTKAAVAEIKQKLAKIGFFNYASIEEYRVVSEELDFLNGQLEDLNKSKQDISLLIRDLDKTMEEMFVLSFRQIDQKYNEIFQTLFEGGRARLILGQGDVLSAGIDIEAQPPGKKLQSLDLLSGGERSMTALALLFAIFAIRPTPFCILDEIDASLDEANIGRYVKYLQTLKGETQFIVITHRKTTMELADMLYGVTMEDGITKVISLRFEDYLQA